MKIEVKQLEQAGNGSGDAPQMTMLVVTGEVTRSNYIVQMARKMIQANGCSAQALAYFDTAATSGLLRSDR